jgi:hypothetical protein
MIVTTAPAKKVSWWYHFAVLGKSVGIGIGAGAGTAAMIAGFVPVYGPVIATAIGGLATAASVVTHYADSGIKAETEGEGK